MSSGCLIVLCLIHIGLYVQGFQCSMFGLGLDRTSLKVLAHFITCLLTVFSIVYNI